MSALIIPFASSTSCEFDGLPALIGVRSLATMGAGVVNVAANSFARGST